MASSLPDSVARSNQYRESNHIDLTLDDDDDDNDAADQYHSPRCAKRARTDTQDQDRLPPAFQAPPSASSSTMNAEMSPFASGFGNSGAFSSMSNPAPSPFSHFSSFVSRPAPNSYRPQFAGPSSIALQRPSDNINLPSNRNVFHHPTAQQHAPRPFPLAPSSVVRSHDRQVIDLTDSPSPPPSGASCYASQPPLPDELPPKTPVCIGQLTVTALIIYPVPYISPQTAADEWASVRLQYDSMPSKVTGKETIHIRTPTARGPNGENISGDVFGVVEQKVADFLGPMLGKGLIRLDAKIRKASGNVRSFLSFPHFNAPDVIS
jgi:SWI/SNF-related matrix-associated actin-dependent regulator of chromatin subfamily A3